MLEAGEVRLVAGMLIAGFFVFLTGAVRWKLAYQAELPEALNAIAESQDRWRWIHIWMVGGIVVTLLGLAGLTQLLLVVDGPLFASFGVVLFATGALPWLAGVTWRLTVLQRAAVTAHDTGSMPEGVAAWSDWFGHLHTGHLVLAYLSWVAIGAAIVDTGVVAEWLGWLGIGLGAAGAIGYVAMKGGPFAPPIMAHLYTMIIGVGLLIRWW